jgi:type II secretory pathway pseudopilin PulG
MPRVKDRRRAQAGTTLVELLVSLLIVGLALVLIVGTFSTALLDAAVAKRNTAMQAVAQSELDRISGSPYDPSVTPYSECFATESSTPPTVLGTYLGSCPSGQGYTFRADVSGTAKSASTQLWTVAVLAWPTLDPIGSTISVYKVNR